MGRTAAGRDGGLGSASINRRPGRERPADRRARWGRLAAVAAAVAGLPAGRSFAAETVYTNAGGTALWTDAGNWDAGVPTAALDARFPSPVPATGSPVTLGAGSGASALIFNNTYTLTGGDLALTTGNIFVSPTFAATIASAVVGGPGNAPDAATLGSTYLTVTGGGTLALTGTNTFTGNIVVDGSTLAFGNVDAQLGATPAGQFKSVIVQNGGVFGLTTGTYNPGNGGTTTNNKRFVIGTGGGTLDVATGATLQLDDANQISGTDTLTKSGAGLLLVDNQAFNFTGAINVTGGTIRVARNAGALGTAAATVAPITVADGATYDLQITQTSQRPITITGAGVGGAGALVDSSTTSVAVQTVTLAGNATVGGATSVLTVANLDGGGGTNRAVGKVGTGILAVTGAGTGFNGTTTVNVTNGGVGAGSPTAFGPAATVVVTGSASEYYQNGAAAAGYTYSLPGDGVLGGNKAFFASLVPTGPTANLNLYPATIAQTEAGANAQLAAAAGFANDASRYFAVAAGVTDSVTVGTGTPWAGIAGDRVTRTFNATVTANSDFAIQATGGATFVVGNSSIAPAVAGTPVKATIVGGVVQLNDATGGYDGLVTFEVANGATLQTVSAPSLGTNATPANNAKVNVLSGGVLNPNGGATLNGNVTIQPGGILNIDDATNLTGTGTVTQFAGSITRITNNGANALAGAQSPGTVPGSVVRLQTDNIADLATKIDNAAVFEANGATRILLTGATGGLTLSANGANTGILTNDGSSRSVTNSGLTAPATITIGAGGGTFVATDGTTLTLTSFTGTNTTGGLLISAGTNTVNFGLPAPAVLGGLAKGGPTGIVAYSGNGTSALTAGAVNVLSGTFQFNGGAPTFNVGGGTGPLTVADGATVTWSSGQADNAAVVLLGNATYNAAGSGTTVNRAVSVSSLASPSPDSRVVIGTNATFTTGTNNLSTTFAGVISQATGTNTNALVKAGTGTMTLTGTNTYVRPTLISGGTLQLGDGGTTGSIVSDVANNGALVFNRSNVYAFANAISGTGGVTMAGTGRVVLTGALSYAGATTVSAGALTVGGTTTSLSTTGGLSVGSGGRFNYLPTTPGPLSLGAAPLALANNSTVGLDLGATAGSQIVTTGSATTAGTVRFALSNGAAVTGTRSFTLLSAAGGLDAASYAVVNPTDYTYTSISKTPAAVTINGVTAVAALTDAYWLGTFAGGAGVWALSDGQAASNFASSAAGTPTPLTPGPTTTVRFSATGATNKATQTLGANLAVLGVVSADTAPVALNDDGKILTIGAGGVTLDAAATAPLTVGANLALAADQAWTNDNATQLLTIGSPATVVATSGFTATVTGAGNTRVAGVAGTGGLAKTGAATLTMFGTSTYSGPTTVTGGTLAGGAANAFSPNSTVVLGNNTTGAATLDVGGFNQVVGGLTVSSNTATANTVTIGSGKTLTISGNTAIGNTATNGAQTVLNFVGGGSLAVDAPGGTFNVGQSPTGTNNSSKSTVSLAALAGFSADLGSGTLNVQPNGDNSSARNSTLALSNTANTITAATVNVGPSSTGAVQTLLLGLGTNVLNVDTVNLGTGNRDTGVLKFATGTGGSVVLRSRTGIGRTGTVTLGPTGAQTTGYTTATVFDVTGHDADLAISTLRMDLGAKTAANTNTVSFDRGTLDIRTLTMAVAKGTGTSSSTLTIGGGVAVLGGSAAFGDAGTGAVSLATAATGELEITGGAVTSTVPILRGAATAGSSAVLTLNGGSLDMTGKAIGSAAAPIDTLSFQSGTLSNVGSINGTGGVAKTTAGVLAVAGTNNYTGPTAVGAGTLVVRGALAATSAVTVSPGATLGGAGSIAAPLTLQGGATLAPGERLGVLNFSGTLSLGAGSRFEVDVGGAAPAVAGTGYDQVNTTAAAGTPLTVDTVTLAAFEAAGYATADGTSDPTKAVYLLTQGGSAAVAGNATTGVRFVDAGGTPLGQDALVTFADGTGTARITYAANWTGNQLTSSLTGGNDVALYNLNVVPEPATASAAALAALGLLGRRRRKAAPAAR